MPWIPEPSNAVAAAAAYQRDQARADGVRVVGFYDGIRGLDDRALLGSWAAEPDLDDPRHGRVRGADAFREWLQSMRQWLDATGATFRPIYLLKTPGRTVEEVAVDLQIDGATTELPVAVVSDHEDDGRLNAIRVYHSMWPLTGGHVVRSPLLARDPSIHLPDVVGDYQRALAAGDLEGILATYEDDATVREPAGGEYRYSGKDQLRRIYSLQFADGAGIPLEHNTVTDDGTAVALEYNVVQWGHTPMTPQAGIAVYQRGRTGKLTAGRIYDDAAPPEASDSAHTG